MKIKDKTLSEASVAVSVASSATSSSVVSTAPASAVASLGWRTAEDSSIGSDSDKTKTHQTMRAIVMIKGC